MVQDLTSSNQIYISGRIDTEPEFSHSFGSETFNIFYLTIPRLSKTCDRLPVIVSERILDREAVKTGDRAAVKGQIRTHNTSYDGRTHLIISVFAKEVYEPKTEDEDKNPNFVVLNGFICKPPFYRETPLKRQITDILLAVNRPFGRSDYIPLIAWGRTAEDAKNLSVGDRIRIEGRMQSRIYQKKITSEKTVEKTAFEVSVSKMEILRGDF
ncbi:MAG: single-stranded DNA-binding protein [Clostridiales bacterium]|nr:single-stranded DNA-binding protein [Clostridiales bacterium]